MFPGNEFFQQERQYFVGWGDLNCEFWNNYERAMRIDRKIYNVFCPDKIISPARKTAKYNAV